MRLLASDSVPLNKSFETQETSDSYRATDTLVGQANILNVWGIDHDERLKKLASGRHLRIQRRASFSSAETEKVKNTAKTETVVANETARSDVMAQYSPSLDVMFETTGDEEPKSVEISPPTRRRQHRSVVRRHAEAARRQQASELITEERIELNLSIDNQWHDGTGALKEEIMQTAAAGEVEFPDERKMDNDTQSIVTDLAIELEEVQIGEAQPEQGAEHDDLWTKSSSIDTTIKRRVICAVFVTTALLVSCFSVLALLVALKNKDVKPVTGPSPQNATSSIWGNDPSENQTSTTYESASPTHRPTVLVGMNDTETSETRVPTRPPKVFANPDTTAPTQAPTSIPSTMVPVPSIAPTAAPTWIPTVVPSTYPTATLPSMPTNSPVVYIPPPVTYTPVLPPSSSSMTPTLTVGSPSDVPACRSRVVVSEKCVLGWRDPIHVDFVNCDPQEDDLVGIWVDGETPENMKQTYVDWVWSCGTQSCIGAPKEHRVIFEKNRLPLGTFRVFLVRGNPDEGVYTSQAISRSFVVSNYCAST